METLPIEFLVFNNNVVPIKEKRFQYVDLQSFTFVSVGLTINLSNFFIKDIKLLIDY